MTDNFNNLLEEDLAARSLAVGQIIEGTVVQISEEGVFVDIGAKSEGHLDLDQIQQEELAKLQVGDKLTVRIIKKVDGEFKLSKKSVDYEVAWNQLMADREANQTVEVKVVEKVKNGYMCEAYGLLQGFIHHTNFKGRPTMGQAYNARILDANRKARKLVFTRRDLLKHEEEEALERDYGLLQEGMVIEGVVDKLSPYGAFIKITDHLTGLLHISEFSFEHVKKPSEVLKPGEVVQVKILQIDREKNKISLSRKSTMKDPLMILVPGEEIEGKVESLADFGVFVRLDNGITGLVHISELSFKKFGHPSELFKPNEMIRVKVLRVQPEERRVSLSAKACERDPWNEVHSRFSVSQHVEGPVTQLLQSGMVMKLDEFFEAFIPISEISEERLKHPHDMFNEGDVVGGYILSIDSAKRRVRVSLRRTQEDFSPERQMEQSRGGGEPYSELSATAGKVTLGDILGSKLDLTMGGKEKEPAKAKKQEAKVAEAATAEPEEAQTEVAPDEPEEVTGEPAAEAIAPVDAAVEVAEAEIEPAEGEAEPAEAEAEAEVEAEIEAEDEVEIEPEIVAEVEAELEPEVAVTEPGAAEGADSDEAS